MAERRTPQAGAVFVGAFARVRQHHRALRVDDKVVVCSHARAVPRRPRVQPREARVLRRHALDARSGAHAARVGVELEELVREPHLVGFPPPQQEHKAVRAHALAQHGNFRQVLLEHNEHAAGEAAGVGEKPHKEPVGVDLVVGDPHRVGRQRQAQPPAVHLEPRAVQLPRVKRDRHRCGVNEGCQKREHGDKMGFCDADARVVERGAAAEENRARDLQQSHSNTRHQKRHDEERRSNRHHGPGVARKHGEGVVGVSHVAGSSTDSISSFNSSLVIRRELGRVRGARKRGGGEPGREVVWWRSEVVGASEGWCGPAVSAGTTPPLGCESWAGPEFRTGNVDRQFQDVLGVISGAYGCGPDPHPDLARQQMGRRLWICVNGATCGPCETQLESAVVGACNRGPTMPG